MKTNQKLENESIKSSKMELFCSKYQYRVRPFAAKSRRGK
ncbi:hypothetical protein Syncc8109_0598 [Synechococcus sp. WH 8109]|nr:hypothetical protein Syncc8109_0598 [Synechococcus sp. WH 8109]